MQALKDQYESTCWKIVDEMTEKFIDLCVDDNNSQYGERMPLHTDQFRAHLEKLNFRFQTKCLDMPARMAEEGSTLDQQSIEALRTADSSMGQELDAIFDLIDGQAKDHFRHQQVVVEHKWNDQHHKFDEIAF